MIITEAAVVAFFAFLITWVANASPYPPFIGGWRISFILFCEMCWFAAKAGINA